MANEILKWSEETLTAIVKAHATGDALAGRFTGDVLKNLTNNYGPAIAAVSPDVWSFPYAAAPIPAMCDESIYMAVEHGLISDKEGTDAVGKAWGPYSGSLRNVNGDWMAVTKALEDGTIRRMTKDGGNELWPTRNRQADLTEVAQVLGRKLEEAGMKLDLPKPTLRDDVTATAMKYQLLCSLVSMGYGPIIFPLIRQKLERTRSLSTPQVTVANDKVSKAVFGRGKEHVEAEGYFTAPDGNPMQLATGKGMSVGVSLASSFPLDADPDTYMLSDVDRFWLDGLSSLAWDGHIKFFGSDILSLMGYTRPRAAGCQETMREAWESVVRLTNTRISIDTSGEMRAFDGEAAPNIPYEPVVNAHTRLVMSDDGEMIDFSVELNVRNDDPLSALPLATYALAKRQLLTFSRDDFRFDGLRLSGEHRRMWLYVLRRLREKGTSNTIVFKTMFDEMGLNPDRSKKSRMLLMLRKMLDLRMAERRIIKSYAWNTGSARSSNEARSVTIEPMPESSRDKASK